MSERTWQERVSEANDAIGSANTVLACTTNDYDRRALQREIAYWERKRAFALMESN